MSPRVGGHPCCEIGGRRCARDEAREPYPNASAPGIGGREDVQMIAPPGAGCLHPPPAERCAEHAHQKARVHTHDDQTPTLGRVADGERERSDDGPRQDRHRPSRAPTSTTAAPAGTPAKRRVPTEPASRTVTVIVPRRADGRVRPVRLGSRAGLRLTPNPYVGRLVRSYPSGRRRAWHRGSSSDTRRRCFEPLARNGDWAVAPPSAPRRADLPSWLRQHFAAVPRRA